MRVPNGPRVRYLRKASDKRGMHAADAVHRSMQRLLRQIIRHLDDGERLGAPRRTDDQIVLPAVTTGGEPVEDEPSAL